MHIAKVQVGTTTGRCLLRRKIPAKLVGGIVSVEFVDPIWDRLSKTVVFRCGCGESKIAEFDGVEAVIPWELLEKPEERLYFGIWGNDSELQLPLIEVPIGIIEAATDPDADPSTDPTLPVWARLQRDLEELKQSGGGAGSLIIDDDGYLTTTAGGFVIDDDGYIVL